MNPASLRHLHQLIVLGGHSLLQYVSESCPFTTGQTQAELADILVIAAEEKDAVGKLTRFLQKQHQIRMVAGSFPAYYTQMNYITIEHLLPKLIAEDEKQVSEIEKILAADPDEAIRPLIQSYLDMKRRHLESLKKWSTPGPLAA